MWVLHTPFGCRKGVLVVRSQAWDGFRCIKFQARHVTGKWAGMDYAWERKKTKATRTRNALHESAWFGESDDDLRCTRDGLVSYDALLGRSVILANLA